MFATRIRLFGCIGKLVSAAFMVPKSQTSRRLFIWHDLAELTDAISRDTKWMIPYSANLFNVLSPLPPSSLNQAASFKSYFHCLALPLLSCR